MSLDLAFIFPGQGSQYAGMGRSLAQHYGSAAQAFEEADSALGFKLSELCFNGPEDSLKQTENTQPALLATSIAALRALREELGTDQLQAAVVGGHSLGEYTALVAAGALQFADALRLVRLRGRYMQEAVPERVGAMAAILKLPPGNLEAILEQAAHSDGEKQVVTAANLNTPEQTVISGHAAAVERAMELARQAGARRAIKLQVSAPFHCPLMQPAADRLLPELERTAFGDPEVPLVNNWQARAVRTAAEAREGLYYQIPNPVRWIDSVRTFRQMGVRRALEIGAGSVLVGLCRAIEPSLRLARFGELADLADTRELLLLGKS